MAIIFQQSRSSSAGTPPGDLEPGQIAFNLADSKGYLGNGTNAKTKADGSAGSPVPTVGKGWIEYDLKVANIATLLTAGSTPSVVKDSRSFTGPVAPTAGQVLTYDAAANGGTGGYIPKAPGTVGVHSIANDNANLNASSGSLTGDAVAGLIATVAGISAKGDIHSGDVLIVTDSGNADASSNVPPGAYIYDGSIFIAQPSGGGAKNLGDLLNVTIAPTAVAAANVGGVAVRDTSVATETAAGAYKITTVLDAGTY